jgi:hypothetical protein
MSEKIDGNPEDAEDKKGQDVPEDEPTPAADEEKRETATPVTYLTYEMICKMVERQGDSQVYNPRLPHFDDGTVPDPTYTDGSWHYDGGTTEPPPSSRQITITVPDSIPPTEPPPSFMARDTNRPPKKGDFISLAEYMADKRKKNKQ